MDRLMAKVFDVERTEKGSGLQSKFNAFTAGKNITAVHGFKLDVSDGHTRGVLLYNHGEGEGTKENRVYAKVVEGVEYGSSELQTKVNSFSKDKQLEVLGTAFGRDTGGEALVAIVYRRLDSGSAEAEAA